MKDKVYIIQRVDNSMPKEPSSVLTEALGNSPTIKIIDHFADGIEFEYSLVEIAEGSGASYASVKNIVPRLVQWEFLVPTRKIGKATLYKINRRNDVVEAFVKFDWLLTEQEVRKSLKKQGIDMDTKGKSHQISKQGVQLKA